MGTVYEAHRADDQYRKRVAIKMVSLLGDRTQALARFQRERQLLARLAHRNIAALLDGGVTAEGEPRFSTEHGEGQPTQRGGAGWGARRTPWVGGAANPTLARGRMGGGPRLRRGA